MRKREENYNGSVRKISNNCYECVIQSRYFNENGNPKRIKRRGKTEAEAREKCKQELRKFENLYEREKELQYDKKTFGEYMNLYLEDVIKPKVSDTVYMDNYYCLKASFFAHPISDMNINKLSIAVFENYFNKLTQEKAASTVRKPISLCKRCCEWLCNLYVLPENYAKIASVKKNVNDEFNRETDDKDVRKKFFSNEDIVKLYDAYKNNLSVYAPVYILMLETMMRGQEILALSLDDIDFENEIIHINKAIGVRFTGNDSKKKLEYYIKTPKNGESRITAMSPLAKEVILYLIERTRNNCSNNVNNLLIPNFKTGKERKMSELERCFVKLCDKLDIDRGVVVKKSGKSQGLNVHALRHTAITIANTTPNANPVNTALMAGHRAIKTENVYTHANIEALRSIHHVSDEIRKTGGVS